MAMTTPTRTQTTLALGMALFLLGSAVIGIAGPKRVVRTCLSACAGAVAGWRDGSDRMDASTQEVDRLRQEALPGATPSPAHVQAEVTELKAEIARLRQLVDRHEKAIQVVGETLDEMAQCRQAARDPHR